jgi:acyl-CoA thioesterase-2
MSHRTSIVTIVSKSGTSVAAEPAGSVADMDLGALFDLEPHGPDTLVGVGPQYSWGGLYGGQIVAQALRAAASTVDARLVPHSLRAYFIRRGDNTQPIRYEVDRIRDGSSFCTRRVVARQSFGAILNLESSFQVHEDAADITTVTMASDLPGPDELEPSSWIDVVDQRRVPARALRDEGRVGTGRTAMWMKVTAPLDDDPLLHRCWLAYLSDDLPTVSVLRTIATHEGLALDDEDGPYEGFFSASLDHTVWFHRPLRADEWHLYDMSCHGYVNGRGVTVGHVFTAAGAHAATVAQEVLVRRSR